MYGNILYKINDKNPKLFNVSTLCTQDYVKLYITMNELVVSSK